MQTLLDRLRERGYRLTAQRRAVASALEGADVHLTAEEVYERAAVVLPELSRATVYSTLHQFADLGEIRELTLEGRSKRYDPNVSEHHHLICDVCAAIHDVQQGLSAPPLPADERHGMSVTASHIVHHGVCADCAAG